MKDAIKEEASNCSKDAVAEEASKYEKNIRTFLNRDPETDPDRDVKMRFKRNVRAIENITEKVAYAETDSNAYLSRYLCRYLLYVLSDRLIDIGKVSYEDLGKALSRPEDEDLLGLAGRYITKPEWNIIKEELQDYETEEYLAALLSEKPGTRASRRLGITTPDSIQQLALKILEPKDQMQIANLCCGNGGFMLEAAKAAPEAVFTGYEEAYDALLISRLRMKAAGIRGKIVGGDVLSDETAEKSSGSFDLAFIDTPFGIKAGKGSEARTLNFRSKKTGTREWEFCNLLCNMLKPEGRGLAVLPAGQLTSHTVSDARKYFIENGLIEAVILLPEGVLGTVASGALAVFSRGNQSVRLVDARDLGTERRRGVIIDQAGQKAIVSALRGDSEISSSFGPEELEVEDWSLSPDSYEYFDTSETFTNGRAIRALTRRHFRGATMRAEELDGLAAEGPTPYRYILVKDLMEGGIGDELEYLTEIPDRYERYLVTEGSILLSKVGSPVKAAVVHVAEGEKILASGNLLVLELEPDLADPDYVMAFLNSPSGQRLLDNAIRRASIPQLDAGWLLESQIPVYDMETQKKIAEAYTERCRRLAELKKETAAVADSLEEVFDKLAKPE